MMKRRFNKQCYRASDLREKAIREGGSLKKRGKESWGEIKVVYKESSKKLNSVKMNERLARENSKMYNQMLFYLQPDTDPFEIESEDEEDYIQHVPFFTPVNQTGQGLVEEEADDAAEDII